MAYQEHSWAASGQADGPDPWFTQGLLEFDGVVDTDIWDDRTFAGLHTPPEQTESGSDLTHGGLLANPPTLEHPRTEPDDAQKTWVRPQGEEWDYVIEVWPGIDDDDDDEECLKSLAEHIYHVNAAFEKKGLDYHLSLGDPVNPEDLLLFGPCRRYVLPRQYRDSERGRLNFLQIFSGDRSYNKAFSGYQYKMSVVYEARNPLPTRAYASSDESRDPKVTAFNHLNPNGDPTLIPSSSPSPSASSLAPTTPPNRYSSPPAVSDSKSGTPKNAQPRMKPIPKPQRHAAKNREGKFICEWNGCNAPIKEFSRKCEWNKHMDKHERPYKCLAVGCENINGFTYSGGLLRHEREVHHKHGGPKNPLYCPHKGCKRHKNSSFARLENLNEHLRRCHTSSGLDTATQNDEPELNTGQSQLEALPAAMTPLPGPVLPMADSPASPLASPTIGMKRKLEDDELREENKRLRSDNKELRRKCEAVYLQIRAMMEQIDLLEKEKATLLDRLKDGPSSSLT